MMHISSEPITLFEETTSRYIDDENDIYPPTLLTRIPSLKVAPSQKIYFAMMYFRITRLRNLLLATHDNNKLNYSVFDKIGYGHSIITAITLTNFPTHVTYDDFPSLYEQMFFTVLKNIKPNDLSTLFSCVIMNREVSRIFENLNERPHMLIALFNYGLIYTTSNVNDYEFEPLKHMLLKHIHTPYIPLKRYHLLVNICPITLENINVIAILTDGTAYEYTAIKKHLQKYNTSPISNVTLSLTHNYRGPRETPKSLKILYLPEYDIFEHFDLCD